MAFSFYLKGRIVDSASNIDTVQQSGEVLNVTGVAQSNAFVSSLMRNLNNSEWLEGATLKEIVADNNNNTGSSDLLRLANFGLQFKQTTTSEEEKDEG